MSTIMLRVTALLLWSAIAMGSPNTAEAIPEILDETGVAFIVLANQDNSISRGNRVYQQIVGKLQRTFRQSDILIFNAVIPADRQPDWSQGSLAISEVLKEINNPYLDTIVIVTGFATPDLTGDESRVLVSLELQLYDVASETVYTKLNETGRTSLVEMACSEACLLKKVDNSLLGLTESISSRTIDLISSQYKAPAQIASRR